MYNWAETALENIKAMVGVSAPPEFLTQLTYLAWNHHSEIVCIDTVRAYTFGPKYFVEVDVVLPEEMPLRRAHDIGESLQNTVEAMTEVERAFVHIDFETAHYPGARGGDEGGPREAAGGGAGDGDFAGVEHRDAVSSFVTYVRKARDDDDDDDDDDASCTCSLVSGRSNVRTRPRCPDSEISLRRRARRAPARCFDCSRARRPRSSARSHFASSPARVASRPRSPRASRRGRARPWALRRE